MRIMADIIADIKAVDAYWLKVILSNRGFHALLTYRLSHLLYRIGVPLLPLILTRIVQILYGIDIDWRARIAGGYALFTGWVL